MYFTKMLRMQALCIRSITSMLQRICSGTGNARMVEITVKKLTQAATTYKDSTSSNREVLVMEISYNGG